MTRLGALVLAAGSGRRAAPADKLLARDPLGRAMIALTVQRVVEAGVDDIVLVLGHEPERIRAACPGLAWVQAPDHQTGIAASLRAGLAEAGRRDWDGAMVCLGDMPSLRPETLRLLIAAWRDGRPDVVLPCLSGTRGNPLLWDRRRFADLQRLTGDVGARALLAQPGLVMRAVACDDPGIFADFDTPAELARFASGPPG